LSGTATHAAAGGIATFPGLSIDKVGTGYSLTASAAVRRRARAPCSTSRRQRGHLGVHGAADEHRRGGEHHAGVEVTARDANGNTATGFTGSVTLAIGTNAGAGRCRAPHHAAVGGVATFPGLSIDKVGDRLHPDGECDGSGDGDEHRLQYHGGTAATLVFTVQRRATVAGGSITPAVEVTARDAKRQYRDGVFTGSGDPCDRDNAGRNVCRGADASRP